MGSTRKEEVQGEGSPLLKKTAEDWMGLVAEKQKSCRWTRAKIYGSTTAGLMAATLGSSLLSYCNKANENDEDKKIETINAQLADVSLNFYDTYTNTTLADSDQTLTCQDVARVYSPETNPNAVNDNYVRCGHLNETALPYYPPCNTLYETFCDMSFSLFAKLAAHLSEKQHYKQIQMGSRDFTIASSVVGGTAFFLTLGEVYRNLSGKPPRDYYVYRLLTKQEYRELEEFLKEKPININLQTARVSDLETVLSPRP